MRKFSLKQKKILIMFPAGVGDLIKDLGIVNIIAQNYQDSRIDILVTNQGAEKFAKLNKYVKKIHLAGIGGFNFLNYLKYFAYKGWKEVFALNKEQYDLLICLTVNPLRKFLLKFVKAKEKIAAGKRTSDTDEEYKVLDILGIEPQKEELFFNNLSKQSIGKGILSETKKNIVVNMFCADSPGSIRDWFGWGKLVEELSDEYNLILIGKTDFEYKREYPLDYSKVKDLVNKTSAVELLDIMSKSDLVVTVDSSPFHMAYAVGVPVVGLFGPVDPEKRIPRILKKGKIGHIWKKLDCAPCLIEGHRNHCVNPDQKLCMKAISVEEVHKKVREMIE